MNGPAVTPHFGPFELLEPLGGGMGIVYRARRVGETSELAIKLLRQERLLDGGARARFAREVKAMQRVRHPGICPVLDAGEVDGMPYLCMPLLRGRSLAAHVDAARRGAAGEALLLPGHRDGAPPWTRVVEIIATVADTLSAAHQEGLVHRDVKPANVWIDEEGDPLLLDFGLAHDDADRRHHLTRTGQIVGTPAYLAPEQLDPRFGPVGPRADVYGLAAVLYEALTLRPPFAGRSRAELFTNVLAGQPVDPRRHRPELPESLAVLIEVALARRPRDRYPSASAMAADLRRFLAGQRLIARRPSLPRRIAAQARRRPLSAVLTGALVVGVGLGASATGRFASAAANAAERQSTQQSWLWLGRFELARSAHAQLPPGWPQHRAALAAWLEQHGRPLLLAPTGAEDVAPGTHAFAARAVEDVEQRLAFAAMLEQQGGGMRATAWARTRAELVADPRFAGLDLVPQPGLVPLGADPVSGLQEFYDLASADPALPLPQRDPASGRLALAASHGIVFVLLPGGAYRPPGQGEAASLPPFLIGKHELTRAQHARLGQGDDPSAKPLGFKWQGERQTLQHPVDRVLYAEVRMLLRRWGSTLPNMEQWEYAAAAGHVDAAQALPGNFGPASRDRFLHAAPVGSFDSNAFGLHDMLGNVLELCVGGDDSELPSEHLFHRGGGYGAPRWLVQGCVAIPADQRSTGLGVRPVRRLVR